MYWSTGQASPNQAEISTGDSRNGVAELAALGGKSLKSFIPVRCARSQGGNGVRQLQARSMRRKSKSSSRAAQEPFRELQKIHRLRRPQAALLGQLHKVGERQ